MAREMWTFAEVCDYVDVPRPKLEYALRKNGITAAKRGGRGQGGGRLFSAGQLPSIQKAVDGIRLYGRGSN